MIKTIQRIIYNHAEWRIERDGGDGGIAISQILYIRCMLQI